MAKWRKVREDSEVVWKKRMGKYSCAVRQSSQSSRVWVGACKTKGGAVAWWKMGGRFSTGGRSAKEVKAVLGWMYRQQTGKH